jgi:hypothetical protein
MMPDRTIRVYGAAPALSARERYQVEGEVARVRALVASLPGEARVRVSANPSGPIGEYTALMMDALARGAPRRAVVPWTVRLLYGRRPWFRASMRALDALGG